MRLDVVLVELGHFPSRAKAQAAIADGLVTLCGAVCTKPSVDVCAGDEIIVTPPAQSYVGRGGLKLSAALDAFALSCDGLVCLDVGASTGAFTECLLRRGAARIYSVDVGHGQLHPSLLSDPRVVSMEGLNARELSRSLIPEPIEFAVMDVSFISQSLIYRALTSILTDGAPVVTLFKPQFEVGRENLDKRGVARDAKTHHATRDRLISAAGEVGLQFRGIIPSPILGGDGNKEYLMHFEYHS